MADLLQDDIHNACKHFFTAYGNKSVDELVDMYADDGVIAVQNSPFLYKKDMKNFFEEHTRNFEPIEDTQIELCQLSPDTCVRRGVMVMQEKQTGNDAAWWYVTTFKKIDGQWKAYLDTGGSTEPLSERDHCHGDRRHRLSSN